MPRLQIQEKTQEIKRISKTFWPQGFLAGGIHSGISSLKSKPDLALFISRTPASVAAVFTTNRVQAAPVIVSRERLRHPFARAIIANSGCANACTGRRGLEDAEKMCSLVSKSLLLNEREILAASTGVIGKFLPMSEMEKGIRKLSSKLSVNFLPAVKAIMTTDTVPKWSSCQIKFGNKTVRIWACAKGSGMIHPNMATMLCFILTDAGLRPAAMKKILRKETARTFNCLSVDGDTSTNDTVFFLANGASGVSLTKKKDLDMFQTELGMICRRLAEKMAGDGEGATKVIEVTVRGARSNSDAKKVAETVSTSPLVKTAIFGNDPNWGRVIAAAGRSGVPLNPDRIAVYFDHCCLVRGGKAALFSEKNARKILRKKRVPIVIDLCLGSGKASYLTCDFSYDYVKINADYTT